MRLFTTIFTIFFFCSANANEIKSIVQVDSYSITNVDLIKEIRINQILRKRSLNDAEKKVLLKNLIEEKIKEIEVVKNNINVNKSAVDKRVTQILGNYKLDDLDQDKIKKYMFKPRETDGDSCVFFRICMLGVILFFFASLHGIYFTGLILAERFVNFASCFCTGRYRNGKYNKGYIF